MSLVRGALLGAAVVIVAGSATSSTPQRQGLRSSDVARLDLWGFDGVTTFCPYAGAMQLKAVATAKDQRRYETWPYTAGFAPLPQELLVWSADMGVAGPDAKWTPAADIFAPLVRDPVISIALRGNPAVKASVQLKATYGCGVAVDLRGAPGRAGRQGTVAQPGEAGGRGGEGRKANVALAYLQTRDRVVAVARVTVADTPNWAAYYVLEPGGRPLHVNVSGGAGGAGGPSGGAAAAGNATVGAQGRPGDGGAGGDGGTVTISHDARHPELASLVFVDNRGGEGGPAGQGDAYAAGRVGGTAVAPATSPAAIAGPPGKTGVAPTVVKASVKELFAAELANRMSLLVEP